MNNKNYIKAFSLLETIISMAIAAIVIGITFIIFSILTENMISYKKSNENTHDLNRFTYCINKDIFESEKLVFNENPIIFYNYSGETVKYYIENNNVILNKKEFRDTFKIKVKEIIIDSVGNRSKKLNFLKIKIKISSDSIMMDLNFYKSIYADELLKKKFKNEF